MPTWATRYVRLNDRDRDLARLRAAAGGNPVRADDGASFAAIDLLAPTYDPEDLAQLSRDFGEALAYKTQTVADLVVFDHFVAGARVRGWTYAGEAGWVRVEGEREPWEAELLFAPRVKDDLIEALESDVSDPEVLASERAEIERLFASARLETGCARPPVDPHALLRALEKRFALPRRGR